MLRHPWAPGLDPQIVSPALSYPAGPVRRGHVNTHQRWVGLAVLALPTLLLSLDVSVLYLALPQLSADLGADST